MKEKRIKSIIEKENDNNNMIFQIKEKKNIKKKIKILPSSGTKMIELLACGLEQAQASEISLLITDSVQV